MPSSGPCVGGPLNGQTYFHETLTSITIYRTADPFELDGKPYTRTLGVYNFAAGSWTYTPVNQP